MKKTIVNLNYDKHSFTDCERKEMISTLEKELNDENILVFWNSLENKVYTVDIND